MKRTGTCLASLAAACLALLFLASTASAITIGAGPAVGTDKRGTVWYEEFQDWTADDLLALDPNNDQYSFTNYADSGRDMVAFYAHDDGTNLYFRVDFFELGYQWEDSQVDVYLGIDCATGGESWFPDFSDFQTDHPWEACIGAYNGSAASLYATNWVSYPASFLGSYWNSELDAVEFGIDRTFLTSRGWDGQMSSLNLVPVVMRIASK